jgi:putative ABC transport system permease protein
MLAKIAFLNMFRHVKRTLLIVFAIFISVFFMEILSGMLDGMRNSFFQNVFGESGHIQIHHEDWKQNAGIFDTRYLMYEDPDLSSIEGIESISRELFFTALVVSESDSLALIFRAVEENTVFYSKVRNGILEGEFSLSQGILLSKSIADVLELSIGEQVNILVEDQYGSPYYDSFPISGIFDSGSAEFDDFSALISLENGQYLIDTPNAVSEIKIRLEDREMAEGKAAEIAQRNSSFLIEDWKTIHGSLFGFIRIFDILIIAINIFVLIVSATVIMNAILMNAFDRLQEIGTLRAIGLNKKQTRHMLLLEGLCYGASGIILAVLLALPVTWYFQENGLYLGAAAETLVGSSRYFFSWSPKNTVINSLTGFGIALAGSAYAAFVAASKNITSAIARGGN